MRVQAAPAGLWGFVSVPSALLCRRSVHKPTTIAEEAAKAQVYVAAQQSMACSPMRLTLVHNSRTS